MSETARGSRHALSLSAASALTASVAFAAALVLRAGGDLGMLRIDDLSQLGAALAAAASAAVASWRTTGRLRTSWAAIGVGAGMWALGQVIWCYYELIAHRDTPFPSLADAGYLVFPIGAALGLWLFPSGDDSATRRRWLLDGGIIVFALITVSWATSLGAVTRAGGNSAFAFTVSLAYPIGDILILSMAILGLCRSRTHHRQLILLSVAMAAMAVADSGFAFLTATGKYQTGSLSDVGWVAAFLLLAVAAVGSATSRSSDVPQKAVAADIGDRPAAATMLPYLPLLIAAVILGIRRAQGHDLDAVEYLSVAATLAMVLARQYLTVRENRSLVTVVAAREAQLHRQAFYDELTGLANRALFINRAEHALQLHHRDLRPVAVLFCDLDDFKSVNDTLGHAAGDELLVRVAERLRGVLRPGDTLARLGGDEFAVLLEDGGASSTLGARLVEAMQDPFVIGELQLVTRVSVGFAELQPEDRTPTVDELLARADIAMYAAKRAGKGQLASYEPTMGLPHSDELALRQPLIDAALDRRIRAVYQPIVHLTSGKIIAFEALARWDHQGVAISPEIFIPILSRAGLLGQLTDDMLEQACGRIAAWSAYADDHELMVGVNVPPSLITDRGFPGRVAAVLGRHDLLARQLVLEITEEALVVDLEVAKQVTRQLMELGVTLSLDDFGTGYSSLLHLQQFPLASLKIDRAFVADIDGDPAAEHLVEGVLALARSLGLAVIAEGVERPEQARVLRRLGCHFAQGFLYARPTKPDNIARLFSPESTRDRAHLLSARTSSVAVKRS